MVEPEDYHSRGLAVQSLGPNPETVKSRPSRKHAIAAAILSFFVPGLGQAYLGKWVNAVAFALPLPLGLVLVSRGEILDKFGGLVGWMLFQLSLMVTASIFAYQSGANAASESASSRVSWLRRIAYVVAAAFLFAIGDYSAVSSSTIRAFKIVAGSMEPTIAKGDRIVADMRFYSHRPIQRGDVAVVAAPMGGELLTKRIAAIGGESIQGVGGRIYVNGTLQQYYAPFDPRQVQTQDYLANFGPLSVPSGKVFLLGDNLAGSWDSRSPEFGLVDVQFVKGKVLYLYWSTDKTRIGKSVN